MTRAEQTEYSLELCRQVIRHKSKSFALASQLLPESRRDDVISLYAWCRRADDAVDLVPTDQQAEAVAVLFRELDAIYAGEAQVDPILQLFQAVVMKYQVPKEYPLELVRGMEMDSNGTRYETLRQLLLYSYRVAGVVGLILCHILGVRSKSALARAAHLGIAMQLTNIARDVAEDWARGRLYLPAEWLQPLQAQPELEAKIPADARLQLKPQIERLLDLADTYYRSADQGLVALPFRSALAVAAARNVYSAIGTSIRAADFQVFDRRVYVSGAQKLWLCVLAGVQTVALFLRRGRPVQGLLAPPLPMKVLDDVICV